MIKLEAFIVSGDILEIYHLVAGLNDKCYTRENPKVYEGSRRLCGSGVYLYVVSGGCPVSLVTIYSA